MRILHHSYAGYPFMIELSRALAQRGHVVEHVCCRSITNTGSGDLRWREGDAETLTFRGLDLGAPVAKYAYIQRQRQESRYGKLLVQAIADFRPDVVLSGNTPLDAQKQVIPFCKTEGIRFVFWLQDLLGVAAHRILRQKIPVLGDWIGRYYLRIEKQQLHQSDAIVLITDDFQPLLSTWGLEANRMHTVENWAPLAETPVRPKANPWSQQHNLANKRCLIYSGNLGRKHNPERLVQLAEAFHDQPDVRVVVISQGIGADWLKAERVTRKLTNLVILDFQPFEALPDVLGTADVLVALLEPDAGAFSVPSKVLTYLCAQRPILLSVPPENLAARIVQQHNAGRIVNPIDADGFIAAAHALLDESMIRHKLAHHGRQYAEHHFNIDRITDRFERILHG